MFTKPHGNVIESADGFAVEFLGRSGLRYVEGRRKMVLTSELLNGRWLLSVEKMSIRQWDPPYGDQPVSREERDRIMKNIVDAFRSQGHEIDVLIYNYSSDLTPNPPQTAALAKQPIRGLFHNDAANETTLWLASWDVASSSWIAGSGKPIGSAWTLEAWGVVSD
jgi:hypothetical protein